MLFFFFFLLNVFSPSALHCLGRQARFFLLIFFFFFFSFQSVLCSARVIKMVFLEQLTFSSKEQQKATGFSAPGLLIGVSCSANLPVRLLRWQNVIIYCRNNNNNAHTREKKSPFFFFGIETL